MNQQQYIAFAALAGLGGALAVACGPAEDDPVAASRAAVTSNPVQVGRNIIDDAAQTIVDAQAGGSMEMDALVGQLDVHATLFEGLVLTPSERSELEGYMQTRTQQIQPQLDQILANNSTQSAAFAGDTCFSRCRFFLRLACENGRVRGLCGLPYGCGAQRDPHPCVVPNSEPCGDDLCIAPERCARFVFAPNRCVLTCNTDLDCPGPQRCRQPFGTAFRRCM